MLKERARIVAGSLLAIDLLLVTGAFFVAFWLRNSLLPALGVLTTNLYPLGLYLPLLPVVLLVWGGFLMRFNLYHSQRSTPLRSEAIDIFRACGGATLILILLVFAFRLDEKLLTDDRISRLWIFLTVALAYLLLLARMITVRLLARWVRLRGLNYRTVLIAGTNELAIRIAESIEHHPYWGYRIVGFVAESDSALDSFGGYPVLGTLERIPAVTEETVVDEVIFALGRQQLDRLEDVLLELEERGVRTRLALNLFPHTRARVEVGTLDELPLLTYSTTPTSEFRLIGKRLIDIAVSTLLLVLALPIMIAIALAVKLLDGGKVLYRQTRCGLNGRLFTLYKFRTMIEDAEIHQSRLVHLNEMDGPVFKIRHDPRITRMGRWLRRMSLDELPQLWNVLRGDMSLVGPRPPVPHEVSSYEYWQRRRLSMRPGLTCLWQVHGRNDLDFDRWMELDLEYIDNWSPLLDLKILMRTIPAVLSGRGAS